MTARVPSLEGAVIGLALGSGGARGCAHIGVIRALEALGVRPVRVAGASMGALVGALYALGMSVEELAGLRLGERIRAAVRLRPTRHGLLDPEPLIALVEGLIGAKTFAETAIPLAVTAVDLERDERVILTEGRVAPAVVASMMVHTLFPPLLLGGRWLSDPGVIDSVPVDVAGGADTDLVIAVSADLVPAPARRISLSSVPFAWAVRSAGRACGAIGARAGWPWAQLVGSALARIGRGKARFATTCRVVWVQPRFGFMNANQFGACDRAIALGEEAVQRVAPCLSAVLAGSGLAWQLGASGGVPRVEP